MVLISAPHQHQRLERLLQSIDYALRDLLKTGNDPLALALYLWILRQHKLSLVNSDDLARWGEAWIYRTFVEGQFSRKKDEQITSAVLVYTLLSNIPGFVFQEDQIKTKVQQLIASELDHYVIPYNSPSYGAIVLFAATILKISEPRLDASAQAVLSAFRDAIPDGRIFGLSFAVQCFENGANREHLLALEQLMYAGLENPRVNYEDQIYLLQALWSFHNDIEPSHQLMDWTEQILHSTPVWSYLMVGQEDLSPASDGQVLVNISHLYRACLLDVAFKHQHYMDTQAKKLREETYRERYIVHYGAFGFGMLFHICIGALLAWLLIPSFTSARRYWLLQDYTAMTPQSALLYMFYVLLASLLLLWIVVFTKTWWSLLIRAKIDRDRDILRMVGKAFLKVFLFWITAIVLAVILNLITGIFGGPFQHAVGG